MTLCRISIVIASVCLPLSAGAGGAVDVGGLAVGVFNSNDLRDAVAAQRAMRREELRREEAWAGRRLTPGELFQLREQVRQQWPGRIGAIAPGEPHGVGRALPAGMNPLPGPTLSASQP